MKVASTLLALTTLVASALAHEDHATPEEIAANRAVQENFAYVCAPQIKAYNEMRKRAHQKILGQDNSAIFLDGAFEEGSNGGKLLGCTPLEEEAKIKNHTCVLTPQVTQGPYYHQMGHPIRQNMAENQLGLPFYIDIGIMDVNTCKPVPNVLVDIWHANATGHYAGHADPDPDLYWEGPAPYGVRKGLLTKFPRWNEVETWLRAAWPTNSNGLSQFTSIFPGYYTGRATHVHIKVHTAWEPLANGTFVTGGIVHTGQFFVEDHINEVIDKLAPYDTNPIRNKWGRTRNWADSLKIYQDSHANGYGPTFELSKVGGVIQQGLLGSITVGVDLTASYDRGNQNQVPYTKHTPSSHDEL